jgi:hypothetical protein
VQAEVSTGGAGDAVLGDLDNDEVDNEWLAAKTVEEEEDKTATSTAEDDARVIL